MPLLPFYYDSIKASSSFSSSCSFHYSFFVCSSDLTSILYIRRIFLILSCLQQHTRFRWFQRTSFFRHFVLSCLNRHIDTHSLSLSLSLSSGPLTFPISHRSSRETKRRDLWERWRIDLSSISCRHLQFIRASCLREAYMIFEWTGASAEKFQKDVPVHVWLRVYVCERTTITSDE